MPTPTGNAAFDFAIQTASAVRQSAIQAGMTQWAVLSGPDPALELSQITLASDVAFLRAAVLAAQANGLSAAVYLQALQALGRSLYA